MKDRERRDGERERRYEERARESPLNNYLPAIERECEGETENGLRPTDLRVSRLEMLTECCCAKQKKKVCLLNYTFN